MAQSKSENRIVVFPNSAAESEGNQVWSTAATHAFLTELRQGGLKVAIATAVAPYSPGSRYDCRLGGEEELQLFAIGTASTGGFLRLKKALNYLGSCFQIMFRVPKKSWWYIFLPGHLGTLACLLCCAVGKPFGIYVRSECPTSGLAGVLYRWFFKKATFVFATGSALAESVKAFNRHVEEVAPMLVFGINDLREKPSYAIANRAKVLFVGSVHREKGVFELAEAICRTASKCDAELILAGSGSDEDMERLRKIFRQADCADRIELVGYVGGKQELTQLYSSADIFCFPSYYEGFARVIYEAMGFGLPIISTDFEGGGGKYFLRDRENCLFVAKKNADDLAERLIEMLIEESLRAKLGRRGFQDASNLYSKYEGVSHGSQVVAAVEATASNKKN